MKDKGEGQRKVKRCTTNWNQRKTPHKKIKDKNPSLKNTRQIRTRVNTTQRKNENKQSTKKRKRKRFANKIQNYEMKQ